MNVYIASLVYRCGESDETQPLVVAKTAAECWERALTMPEYNDSHSIWQCIIQKKLACDEGMQKRVESFKNGQTRLYIETVYVEGFRAYVIFQTIPAFGFEGP